jgi:hypothetical protein
LRSDRVPATLPRPPVPTTDAIKVLDRVALILAMLLVGACRGLLDRGKARKP